MQTAPDITGYRKHWAERFGRAPFLPMSRAEMELLGWDSCDIIIITGDAYVLSLIHISEPTRRS